MYKIKSPINFEVHLAPYCKDCNMSDLTINTEFLWCVGGKDVYLRQLTCSKYSLCKQIYEHLKYETEKGEEKTDGIPD